MPHLNFWGILKLRSSGVRCGIGKWSKEQNGAGAGEEGGGWCVRSCNSQMGLPATWWAAGGRWNGAGGVQSSPLGHSCTSELASGPRAEEQGTGGMRVAEPSAGGEEGLISANSGGRGYSNRLHSRSHCAAESVARIVSGRPVPGSQRLDLQWSPGKTLCKGLPASTEEPGERYPWDEEVALVRDYREGVYQRREFKGINSI